MLGKVERVPSPFRSLCHSWCRRYAARLFSHPTPGLRPGLNAPPPLARLIWDQFRVVFPLSSFDSSYDTDSFRDGTGLLLFPFKSPPPPTLTTI